MFKRGSSSAEAKKIGKLGGAARAEALTPRRRKLIARKAAKQRWAAFYAARRAALTK